jgi:hypothetical protein
MSLGSISRKAGGILADKKRCKKPGNKERLRVDNLASEAVALPAGYNVPQGDRYEQVAWDISAWD